MAQANIKAVITAEDRASGALKGFGNAVDNVNDKIVAGAKKAAFALTAAGAAATTFAVKSAADFEQTRIGLENMLGSADAARAMLSKVSKFAAETPFEFPELAQAVRQLVAFGFSGEEAFKAMTQLGDVSAAIGAPIGDLAYLMGTLKAQGRAFMIDIRQFAQRGIPIYEYLAKVFKTNTEEVAKLIEAGKVGFPEVQKAFEMMTAEGGKFHGTMAKQSKSLSGLFSTLKDVIGQTARELVGITAEGDIKSGSLFDKLRQGTAGLIENLPKVIENMKQIVRDIIPVLVQWAGNVKEVAYQIGDYLAPKLEALWNTVELKVLPVLTRLWKEVIEPLLPVIGTLLVAAIGLAIDQLNLWLSVLTPVMNFMLDNKATVIAFAVAFGTLAIAMNFTNIANMFSASMVVVKGAIATTQATFVGLNAFLLGFGGFAVIAAAAVIAGGIIVDQGNKAKAAWDRTTDAVKKAADSNDAVIRQLAELKKSGTPEQQARASKALAGLGGSWATGGFTGTGNSNELAGVVHKGEYVLPQNMVDQRSGLPKTNGSTFNITVQAGAFMGSQQDARKYAKMIMDAYKDLMAGSGVMA